METKKELSEIQIWNLIKIHQKNIQSVFDYDLTKSEERKKHADLITRIGQNYLNREYREFICDEQNIKIFTFLLYYFNNCRLAEKVFENEDYKLHKNLLFVGSPGTGKTLTMQIFSDYLKLTKNQNWFRNVSVTQMMNYYKIHGHIDLFTFNEIESGKCEGIPFNICLNDIGIETENQKSFGTSLDTVIDEFLYARYEIYQQPEQKKYHLTSNLSVKNFKERFENRLIDRFKSFNVIEFNGKSKRK